ncbi:MAG: hypothetical protein RSD40_05760 [Bacilli bacterium]
MKEAVGSTQLLRIVLIFLAIYIIFMATVINYTTTFRVKNQIITIIEKLEGFDEDEINKYVSNARYTSSTGASGPHNKKYDVVKMATERGPYYRVTTYVNFQLPLVNNAISFKVSGETRVLYNLRTGEE